jgi:hypothetical protein
MKVAMVVSPCSEERHCKRYVVKSEPKSQDVNTSSGAELLRNMVLESHPERSEGSDNPDHPDSSQPEADPPDRSADW